MSGMRFRFAFDGLGLLGLEFGKLLYGCSQGLFFGFGFGFDDFGKTFALFAYPKYARNSLL
jgi:hypothetical protein